MEDTQDLGPLMRVRRPWRRARSREMMTAECKEVGVKFTTLDEVGEPLPSPDPECLHRRLGD